MKDDMLYDWLKRIEEKQSTMTETLVRNTASLEEHVRRTNLLEQEIRPIKKHVALVQNSAVVLGVLAAGLEFAHKMGWLG